MNGDINDMRKEEIIAKLKEFQTFLAKECDEASTRTDPHNPSKDYYEGAARAFEISVYTMCHMLGMELPEGWQAKWYPVGEN